MRGFVNGVSDRIVYFGLQGIRQIHCRIVDKRVHGGGKELMPDGVTEKSYILQKLEYYLFKLGGGKTNIGGTNFEV